MDKHSVLDAAQRTESCAYSLSKTPSYRYWKRASFWNLTNCSKMKKKRKKKSQTKWWYLLRVGWVVLAVLCSHQVQCQCDGSSSVGMMWLDAARTLAPVPLQLHGALCSTVPSAATWAKYRSLSSTVQWCITMKSISLLTLHAPVLSSDLLKGGWYESWGVFGYWGSTPGILSQLNTNCTDWRLKYRLNNCPLDGEVIKTLDWNCIQRE